MCVKVGSASSKDTFIWGFNPFFSNVQTPFGPLFYIVFQIMSWMFPANYYFIFYLKSGIPAGVLIPAPVCITTCLASLTHFDRIFIFSATSSKLSNFYQDKNMTRYGTLQSNNHMNYCKSSWKRPLVFLVSLYLRKVISHRHKSTTFL